MLKHGKWLSPQLRKALEELEETSIEGLNCSPPHSSFREHYMGEVRTFNWWSHEEESNENGEATIDTMEQDLDLSMPCLAPNVPKLLIHMPLVEDESNMELPSSDLEEGQAEHEGR